MLVNDATSNGVAPLAALPPYCCHVLSSAQQLGNGQGNLQAAARFSRVCESTIPISFLRDYVNDNYPTVPTLQQAMYNEKGKN